MNQRDNRLSSPLTPGWAGRRSCHPYRESQLEQEMIALGGCLFCHCSALYPQSTEQSSLQFYKRPWVVVKKKEEKEKGKGKGKEKKKKLKMFRN